MKVLAWLFGIAFFIVMLVPEDSFIYKILVIPVTILFFIGIIGSIVLNGTGGYFVAGFVGSKMLSDSKDEKLKQDKINNQFAEKLNNIEKKL